MTAAVTDAATYSGSKCRQEHLFSRSHTTNVLLIHQQLTLLKLPVGPTVGAVTLPHNTGTAVCQLYAVFCYMDAHQTHMIELHQSSKEAMSTHLLEYLSNCRLQQWLHLRPQLRREQRRLLSNLVKTPAASHTLTVLTSYDILMLNVYLQNTSYCR
jgi:hypothetical protein